METPETRRYYGQQQTFEGQQQTFELSSSRQMPTPSDQTFPRARRDFLQRKHEEDLTNVKIWNRFTVIASAAGVAVTLSGVSCAIILGLRIGLGGVIGGGVSSVSGLLTTLFLI